MANGNDVTRAKKDSLHNFCIFRSDFVQIHLSSSFLSVSATVTMFFLYRKRFSPFSKIVSHLCKDFLLSIIMI